jgi:hypothetical protein
MKTIEIKWSTEDVLCQAEQLDLKLTEDQADEVLENVFRCHDAEVGINWDVISFHIENLLFAISRKLK